MLGIIQAPVRKTKTTVETNGSYTCDEQNIMQNSESLYCTPEVSVTLCVNSTSVRKFL